MEAALDETNRRRAIQEEYNRQHDITPQGIVKSIRDLTDRVRILAESKVEYVVDEAEDETRVLSMDPTQLPPDELAKLIKQIEREMKEAAKNLEFERAAELRDQLVELRQAELGLRV